MHRCTCWCCECCAGVPCHPTATAGLWQFCRATSQPGHHFCSQRHHAVQVGTQALVLRVEGRREDVAVPLLVVAGAPGALPDRQAHTVCCVAARDLKAFRGGSMRPQPALVVPHPLLNWCTVAVPDLHNSPISCTSAAPPHPPPPAAATSTAVSFGVAYTCRQGSGLQFPGRARPLKHCGICAKASGTVPLHYSRQNTEAC